METRELLSTITIAANKANAGEQPQANSLPDPGQLTVTRDAAESTSLSVTVQIAGTATYGSDYSQISGAWFDYYSGSYLLTVTIPENQTSTTIDIGPLNDGQRENAETVVVTLQEDTSCGCGCCCCGGGGYTVGSPSSATVTIADNDDWQVSIQAADAAASERGAGETADPGQIVVTRSGQTDLSNSLTFYYEVSGTAVNGSDYPWLYGTATIQAGQTTAAIGISPYNNNMVDGSRTVTLTLPQPSTDCCSGLAPYTIAAQNSATVTIADNDAWQVKVEAADDTAREPTTPSGSATLGHIRVTRYGETDLTYSLPVTYATSGTAVGGTNYTALPGNVTIPSGATSVLIDVTPLYDGAPLDGDKSLTVTLEQPSACCCCGSAAYTVGSPSAATLTIHDSDNPLSVEAGSNATINEGSLFTGSGSFADSSGTSWTATVNYGDGSGAQALTLASDKTFSLSHTYGQEGQYMVTVSVTASDNRTGSDTRQVNVQNVAPTVEAGAGGTLATGTTFSGSGSFSDPGADTWTATVDYGDGSGTQALTLASDKTFCLSHAYADSGNYTVTVSVVDDSGGQGSDTLAVTVRNRPALDLDFDNSSGATGSGFSGRFRIARGPAPHGRR